MKPGDAKERAVFSSATMISDSDSWITSLITSLRDLVRDTLHPRKIQTTAAPVEVREIWSRQSLGIPGLLSIAAHALVVGLALVPWATSLSPQSPATMVQFYNPVTPLILNLPLDRPTGGGGGGGMNTLAPPSLGNLPRAAEKQLAPPTPEVKNLDPILVVEPTIVAPQLTQLPRIATLQLGDPEGIPGPPSAGPGLGGGIGTGTGRGVGSGNGLGFSDGSGGGTGGEIFSVGGGVTKPTLIKQVHPEYSDAARRAKYQGTLLLETIVRRDGTVEVRRVINSLGYGLDEMAIAAVKQWQFRPATTNGRPVDVWLQIEVRFSLVL